MIFQGNLFLFTEKLYLFAKKLYLFNNKLYLFNKKLNLFTKKLTRKKYVSLIKFLYFEQGEIYLSKDLLINKEVYFKNYFFSKLYYKQIL